MSQMEPASQNAGDVTATRTVRMAAMRKIARAPKECATPRPSLPARIQVLCITEHPNELRKESAIFMKKGAYGSVHFLISVWIDNLYLYVLYGSEMNFKRV